MKIIESGGIKIKIENGCKDNKTAVLFFADISGGALTDRFDTLKNSIIGKKYAYVAVEIWRDADDVKSMTLQYIFSSIDSAVLKLKELGYSDFYAIGKSFGGGMLIARNHPVFEKLVLWAPAIGVGDISTIQDLYKTPLSKIESVFDIAVNGDDLNKIKAKVTILRGNKDQIVPLFIIKKLLSFIPEAQLKTIRGMGHSHKNKEHERLLVENTMSALIQ